MPKVGCEWVAILSKVIMKALFKKVKFEQSLKKECKPSGSVVDSFQAEVTSCVKVLR